MCSKSHIKLEVSPAITRLIAHLEETGYATWIVGGWVRDSLRDRTPHDIDLASSAPARVAMSIFEKAGYKVVPVGLAFGTILVMGERLHAEVTTLRHDGTYTNHRHPDTVRSAATIEEDLSRRDFTINAMAYHPARGLIDPFGGYEDLLLKRLRTVGSAYERLTEDALRIVRALRLASELNFTIDAELVDALYACSNQLVSVASERVGKELEKCARAPFAYQVVQKYPEIFIRALIRDVASPYEDILRQALFSEMSLIGCAQNLIGIPDEYLFWASIVRVLSAKSADMSGSSLLKRMALPHGLRLAIQNLVKLMHVFEDEDSPDALKLMHEASVVSSPRSDLSAPPLVYRLLAYKKAQVLGRVRTSGSDQKMFAELLACERALGIITADKSPYTRANLCIDGSELVSLGIEPGPDVGDVLALLLKRVMEGRSENTQKALRRDAIYLYNRLHLKRFIAGNSAEDTTKSTAENRAASDSASHKKNDEYDVRKAKPPIGLELERFVIDEHKKTVFYEGEHNRPGLKDLLEVWATFEGAQPIYIEGKLLGIAQDIKIFEGSDRAQTVPANISLEPGSQFEMSIGPAELPSDLYHVLQKFQAHFAEAADELGVSWSLVALGINPQITLPDEAPLLQKERYLIMDKELPGAYARDMMRLSASTQVSIDYCSNLHKQYLLAAMLSPLIYLMCANTGLWRGSLCPLARIAIWDDVDRARTGLPADVFSNDCTIEDYVSWLEGVPALYEDDQGALRPTKKTIKDLLYKRIATKEDIETFASFVFPDVRLKGFFELRAADSLPPHLAVGYTAVMYGIFYDEKIMDALYAKLRAGCSSLSDIAQAKEEISKRGWDARVYGYCARDIAAFVIEEAMLGLSRTDKKFAEAFYDWVKSKMGSSAIEDQQ